MSRALAAAPMPDFVREMSVSAVSDTNADQFARDVRATIAWCNTFLKQRGFEAKNLSTDFRDGVRLINLLEVAFNDQVGSYNTRPKLK